MNRSLCGVVFCFSAAIPLLVSNWTHPATHCHTLFILDHILSTPIYLLHIDGDVVPRISVKSTADLIQEVANASFLKKAVLSIGHSALEQREAEVSDTVAEGSILCGCVLYVFHVIPLRSLINSG